MALTVYGNSLVVVSGALGTGQGCCCGCCCIDGALDSTRASRQSCEAAGGTWLLPVSVCYVGGVENGDYTNRQDCEYCEPIISTYTCTESTPTGSLDIARTCFPSSVAAEESCPPGSIDNGLFDAGGFLRRECTFCFSCPQGTEPYVDANGQQRCRRDADCPPGFEDSFFQDGNCYRVTTVTDCVDCPGGCSPDPPTGYTGPCGAWYTSCPPCSPPPPIGCCCIDGVEHPEIASQVACEASGGTWYIALCQDIPCTPPPGCCCIDGEPDLTKTTQAACTEASGTWLAGVSCDAPGVCEENCNCDNCDCEIEADYAGQQFPADDAWRVICVEKDQQLVFFGSTIDVTMVAITKAKVTCGSVNAGKLVVELFVIVAYIDPATEVEVGDSGENIDQIAATFAGNSQSRVYQYEECDECGCPIEQEPVMVNDGYFDGVGICQFYPACTEEACVATRTDPTFTLSCECNPLP